MSVDFSGTQYATHAAAAVAGMPLTIVGWASIDNIANSQIIVGITGGANESFLVQASGNAAGDPIRAFKAAGGVTAASAAGGYTASPWTHVAGVFASATSMLAYTNGVAGTLQTTSLTPGALTRTNISVNSAAGNNLDGRIAHAAIYNVALSGTDIAELATGVLPTRLKSGIQPVAYWPLISASDLTDKVGTFHLTATGTPTTSASNPPQIDQAPGTSAASATVEATGVADADAAGIVQTGTASLIAGTATAVSGAEAAGAVVSAAASLLAGTAEASASAVGGVVAAGTSVDPGQAAGEGEASGATVAVAIEPLAGAASGAGSCDGETVSSTASLLAGEGSGGEVGDGAAAGSIVVAVASLSGGAATGENVVSIVHGGGSYYRLRVDGDARGSTLWARARVVSGRASADSSAPGRRIAVPLRLVAGAAGVSVSAQPAMLVAGTSVFAGAAQGEDGWIEYDNDLLLLAA